MIIFNNIAEGKLIHENSLSNYFAENNRMRLSLDYCCSNGIHYWRCERFIKW